MIRLELSEAEKSGPGTPILAVETVLSGPPAGHTVEVRRNPGNPDILYACDVNAGVLTSFDAGMSWHAPLRETALLAGESSKVSVSAVAVSSSRPGMVMAGNAWNGRIYGSADYGKSWWVSEIPRTDEGEEISVLGLAFGSSDPANVIASADILRFKPLPAENTVPLISAALPLSLFAAAGFILFMKTIRKAATDADRPPPVDGGPFPALINFDLTDTEKKVAVLILNGRSNKEIAGELYVSPATVKTHIHNIYRKTGAKNRMHLLEIMKK